MDEKKMIPLFDPNDRGGNSKSHLNPQIYRIVIGNDIDPATVRALVDKRQHFRAGVVIDEPLLGESGSEADLERRAKSRAFWEELLRSRGIKPEDHGIVISRIALTDFAVDSLDKALLNIPPRQLFKDFSGREAFVGEPPTEPNYIEHGQKRGAFDRTGDSPAKTLKKKRKWWER